MNGQDSTALERRPTGLVDWEGAAARGLAARRERESIIKEILVEGQDYGKIPGTDKPALLKAGAEKISDCLNLCPTYELVGKTEDWTIGRFAYQYRCSLILRGTDVAVATGIGSCNSLENRYRWRNQERACPECKQPAIIKGSAQYGGGFLCWKKKGGCGKKWTAPAEVAKIEAIPAGKIENDDPFTIVNTIDKMAQKRALVAANLNLGFSHIFTQDVEDGAPDEDRETQAPATAGGTASRRSSPPEPPEPGTEDGPPPEGEVHGEPVISEPQRRRLYALSRTAQTKRGWSDSDLAEKMDGLLSQHGFSSDTHITRSKYDAICKTVQAW